MNAADASGDSDFNATPRPPTDPDAVELWFAACSTGAPDAIQRACEPWLDPDEVERGGRFRKATSRNQHLLGRGMARRLLGGDAVPPESVRFAVADQGKPAAVAPPEAVQPFNIAHTDGMVVCGVGREDSQLVGVDVERLSRNTDAEVARRYFSPPEFRFLCQCPDESERRRVFLRIWTLKESFIKAIGTGLRTPLSDFAFEQILSPRPRLRILSPKLRDDRRWEFHVFPIGDDFIASAAVGCPADATSPIVRLRDFREIAPAVDDHPPQRETPQREAPLARDEGARPYREP